VHEPTGTLIVGDTLFHTGRLRPSRRAICTDFRLNERSARVLGELEYERVAFTHGPEIVRDARRAVRRAVEATGGRRG
jgi:glyoxylase-like metal-dependent hydrolase (beta-lactamase superfamily II)